MDVVYIPLLYSPFQNLLYSSWFFHLALDHTPGPSLLAFQRQLKASIFVNKMITKNKKKVQIKHLLNIDHTSHFVTTFFAYLTLSLWFSFCLYKSVDKNFILYFHTELFQRALMTVLLL